MARKRMLHPEFFSSAVLSRLSFRTMLTFAGLWVYCDDAGRGECDPMFIRSRVFPRRSDVTLDDVANEIATLTAEGLVCKYELGGVGYLHIPTWHEHQRISHATPSRIPPCELHESAAFSLWWRDSDVATDKVRKEEKRRRKAARND